MTDEFPATDWSRYDVPTIAAMLIDTNERSWDQVNAWRRIATTLDTHQTAMAAAIDQLAQTWPPDASPAAAEYLGYAQAVRASARATVEAASANATALAGALTALDQARERIGVLHETWATLPEIAMESTAPDPAIQLKSSLNQAAARIMTETDQAILDSVRRLQVPPVLGELPRFGGSGHAVTDESGGSERTAPEESKDGRAYSPPLVRGVGNTSTGKSGSSPRTPPSISSGEQPETMITQPPEADSESTTDETPVIGPPRIDGVSDSDDLPGPPGRGRTLTGGPLMTSSLGPRGANAAAPGPNSIPGATFDGSEPPESGAGPHLAPPRDSLGMFGPGVTSLAPTSGMRTARRRPSAVRAHAADSGVVPALIVPSRTDDAVHDPGPGVIGIDL